MATYPLSSMSRLNCFKMFEHSIHCDQCRSVDQISGSEKNTFTQQQILAVVLKQAKGLLKRILIEPRKHQAVIKV